MSAPRVFSFPILPVMEIVSCIQELTNIPAKEADFQRPQPEVIAKLLEACLESFMGISAQELRQPSFETLNLLGPDHDIYVDAIGHQKFFSTVQSFMQTVGVRDFSLADLHKPQEKRTIRNFSAIINFAKFREERIQRYNELSAALQEELSREVEEVQAAQAQLRQLRQKREREEPQVKQLEEETSKLEAEVRQLNKAQAARHNEAHEIKEKNIKVNDQTSSTKLQILNIRQEVSRLQTLIVRSPEKIKKMLEDMAAQIEKEKASTAESEDTFKTHQARHLRLMKIEKNVKKCLILMGECDVEMEKLKKVTKEIKEKKAEIRQYEQLAQQQAASEKSILSKIEVTQTKIAKLGQQFSVRKATAEEALADARKELQDMEAVRAINRSKIDQNTLVARQMQQEIDHMRAKHEAEVTALRQKCDKLLGDVQEYNNSGDQKVVGSANTWFSFGSL